MALRDQDILRAASMYYLQDVKMESIARHLGTSRSTVSRMIKEARDTGLVEISLRPLQSRVPGIRQHFRERYGIEAFIVPIVDGGTDDDRHEQLKNLPRAVRLSSLTVQPTPAPAVFLMQGT